MTSKHATGYVRVRQLKRGDVYYAKIRLANGKHLHKALGKVWMKRSQAPPGFLTKAHAEAQLALLLSAPEPAARIDPTCVTFGQAAEEYLDDRERNDVRPSTMYDYRSVVRRLIQFFGASAPLESITTERVDELREEMQDEGRAGRTINKTLSQLSAVMCLAMRKHKQLAVNPVALAQRSKQKQRKLEQHLLADEVSRLAAAAASPQDAALYEVACFTGLRFGELKALRWADIDWDGQFINVNRNHPCHGVEGDPKSGKPRAVPLWAQASQVLAKLGQREHFTRDDDYVFVTNAGGKLDYNMTRRAFVAARDRARLTSPRPNDREMTFHDLRHSFGSLAAAIYGNLREVQEYMGHASITTTEIYAHSIPRHDAADRGSAGLKAMLSKAAGGQIGATEPISDEANEAENPA